MKRSELKAIVNEVLNESGYDTDRWLVKVTGTMNDVKEALNNAIETLNDIEGAGKQLRACQKALHDIRMVK
jgi:hypothetical protein